MAADTVEVAQGSGGGEVLVAEVGVADVGLGEGVVDEGFDYGGVYADSDVARSRSRPVSTAIMIVRTGRRR